MNWRGDRWGHKPYASDEEPAKNWFLLYLVKGFLCLLLLLASVKLVLVVANDLIRFIQSHI